MGIKTSRPLGTWVVRLWEAGKAGLMLGRARKAAQGCAFPCCWWGPVPSQGYCDLIIAMILAHCGSFVSSRVLLAAPSMPAHERKWFIGFFQQEVLWFILIWPYHDPYPLLCSLLCVLLDLPVIALTWFHFKQGVLPRKCIEVRLNYLYLPHLVMSLDHPLSLQPTESHNGHLLSWHITWCTRSGCTR